MSDKKQPHRAIAARGPTLVLCEHSGEWAHRLRRLLDAAPATSAVRIVETRSAAECLEALGRIPTALVAVELTASNCLAALDLLVALDSRFPQARTVVLAARSMRGYRGLAHELGAVCVIASPWQLPTLVEMVSRPAVAAQERNDAGPGLALDMADEIWGR